MDGPLGYVANTDFDWYTHLLQRFEEHGRLDEVNFWQPGGSTDFKAVKPGAPFFFKLKSPHYAIGGFGYFARASRIPASLAWEAFGEWNGAATLEEFRSRLHKLKVGGLKPGEDPTIGCLMISEPVFFPEALWVPQPADFHRQIVSGKTYPLQEGTGAQLWQACRDAAQKVDATQSPGVASGDSSRWGDPTLVRPRLGQGTFRVAVTDAYGRCCAVSEEHSLPVLDAAHIRPYGGEHMGTHEVRNGLLLRTDIHRLYDRGYVTVTPDLKFRVSPRLKADWGNGRSYESYRDRTVRVPSRASERPDTELLAWHASVVFKR